MASNLNEDDFYLSDIHVEYENTCLNNETNSDTRITRIEYVLPDGLSDENETKNRVESCVYDTDGDLTVSRKSKRTNVISIEHFMHTKLSHVGLQLWRASFFMCDYILNNSKLCKDKTVVELGAGLGVASMFCSLYAKFVFCTDLLDIVKQARVNFKINENSLNLNERRNVLFRALDWSEYEELFQTKTPAKNIRYSDISGEYLLGETDFELLKDASIFFAADVVYDNMITLKLMNLIYAFMVYGKKQPKACYIANEKRVNFNTQTLSSTDTAYSFFMECLNDLDEYEDHDTGYRFKIEQLNCENLPFYILNYKRNNYLSIWKIECNPI
jgi:predicted nicotinamide N-methyase